MISFSLTGWRGKHGQDVVWRWRGTACVALGRPQNLSWCRYFSFPFLCVSQPPVRVFRHEPDNKPMQSVVRWTSMDRLRGRRESAKPWSDAETDDERVTKNVDFQMSSTRVSKQVARWRRAIEVALTLSVCRPVGHRSCFVCFRVVKNPSLMDKTKDGSERLK